MVDLLILGMFTVLVGGVRHHSGAEPLLNRRTAAGRRKIRRPAAHELFVLVTRACRIVRALMVPAPASENLHFGLSMILRACRHRLSAA